MLIFFWAILRNSSILPIPKIVLFGTISLLKISPKSIFMPRELSYGEVRELIDRARVSSPNFANALSLTAYVAIQYATAARVSEVGALRRKDVQEREDMYIFRLVNRKNKKQPVKYVPVLKAEKWLAEIISDYLKVYDALKKQIEKNYNPAKCEDSLWIMKSETARKYIRVKLGINSHALRHSRLTHLATIFDMDLFSLQRIAGHARADTTIIYVHKKTQDIVRKMKEGLKRAFEE